MAQLRQRLGNQAIRQLLQAGRIQARLSLGRSDDPYEREAERVADQVMRMPDSAEYSATHGQQPFDHPLPGIRCLRPGHDPEVNRQVLDYETDDDENLLQASGLADRPQAIDPLIAREIKGLEGRGRPLAQTERNFFEPRFGASFERVRIHTDANAARTAKAIDAHAYTLGRNIVFASGRYNPGSNAHRRLLAHELTHVIQQTGRTRRSAPVSTQTGAEFAQGHDFGTASGNRRSTLSRSPDQTIQRDEEKDKPKTKFKSLQDEAAEKEYEKLVAKYKKAGKSEREAAFLAMDEMFAGRVKATGGTRKSGSATMPTAGTRTYLYITSPVVIGGTPVRRGLMNAGIDDKSYNCHSYTFTDAKTSKLKTLKSLAKTIPEGPEKGKKYYESDDLIKNKIHFDAAGVLLMIYPRWIATVSEVKDYLKKYRKRKTSDKLSKSKATIVMYSYKGDFPHSGKVTKLDKKGNPVKVKGKWGHYSLFEHEPAAVPAYYGTPDYYREK